MFFLTTYSFLPISSIPHPTQAFLSNFMYLLKNPLSSIGTAGMCVGIGLPNRTWAIYPRDRAQKKTDTPSPAAITANSSSVRVELVIPSPFQVGILTGLVLCRSCERSHSHYEFTYTVGERHPGDSFLLRSSQPLALTLSPASSVMVPKPW